MELPAPLDAGEVFELFRRASFRPEILGTAADDLRFGFGLQPADVPRRFAEQVEAQISGSDNLLLRVVHSLTPLQSAVLRVMAAQGEDYAPFEAQTLALYEAVLGARAEAPAVQQALVALQDKSLIWKAARGTYALEEASLADLMDAAGMLADVPRRNGSSARPGTS